MMELEKHNGLEILGKISGLGKEKTKEIFERVKDNLKKLETCNKHNFIELSIGDLQTSGIRYKGVAYGKIYKCVNCQGQVSAGDKKWYEIGLKHGTS